MILRLLHNIYGLRSVVGRRNFRKKKKELIWIIPDKNMLFINSSELSDIFGVDNHVLSGRMIRSKWPLIGDFDHICQMPKIRRCISHWRDGIAWRKTGIFDRYLKEIEKKGMYEAYSFQSIEDIDKRYINLDNIFKQAKKDGRLRTEEEITIRNFKGTRGYGYLHIGPDKKLYWSGGSQHRLAIAYVLKLPIPVNLGAYHESSLGYLKEIRLASSEIKPLKD